MQLSSEKLLVKTDLVVVIMHMIPVKHLEVRK